MSKTKSDTRRPKGRQESEHELASNMVKALSHPLRMRILVRLNEGVASPNEMAKEFDESLPLVSYHVRILRELDCIELVKTTPRRGAIEHHYRALKRAILDDEDWAKIPPSARPGVSSTVLAKALGDVRDAVDAGTFDERTNRHLSYSALLLDDEGFDELNHRLDELMEWANDEQARAVARRQKSGAPEVRTRLTMMCYTAPPAGGERTTNGKVAAKRRTSKR